jgi:two-component system, cell cycle sensor histidine kinase and response regulator CckA
VEWIQPMTAIPDILRSTFDEIQLGIAHTSLKGRFVLVNRWLRQMLGYSEDEFAQLDFASISHPDEVRQDLAARNQLIAGVIRRYVREKRYRRKDGTFVWANLTVSVHRDDKGFPVHFISIIEDLTERKQIELQTRQAHKMEAIGRLAGGIAHDFNNMLTAIEGYADLAVQQLGDREPGVQRDIEEIRAAGRSAASLTRQLLAFSRRQLLQPQIVDLNSVLERTTGFVERLIGEHIDTIWKLGAPLDRVCADPTQLEQVVLNLALNARDAMPDGGTLTIETANAELDAAYVREHPDSCAGPHVMLAITDSGLGMDAGVQERLFEPFYTTKELGQGTGLGLATVYGIVKQSGGSIFVDSEPGHGTTFKIYLPSDERSAEIVEMPPPTPVDLHGTETILLVEDQLHVRLVIRETLARHGYTVIEACDGEEALELAARHEGLDLLLTDIVMPGISGPVLADRLIRMQAHAKVLYISGYTREGVEQRGLLTADTAFFIQKPFTPELLLRKLREVFDG